MDFTLSVLLIIFWKCVSFPLVYLHTRFKFETVSTNVTLESLFSLLWQSQGPTPGSTPLSVDTSTGTGFCLFFRKGSLRLAFLLRIDGLAIFLVLPGLYESRPLSFASREKEIVEPILREKLKAKPWSANVWQRSRHLPRRNHFCQQLEIQLCLLAVWLMHVERPVNKSKATTCHCQPLTVV